MQAPTRWLDRPGNSKLLCRLDWRLTSAVACDGTHCELQGQTAHPKAPSRAPMLAPELPALVVVCLFANLALAQDSHALSSHNIH